MDHPEDAGVITFLFTDIEGSTRLWEAAPATMRPALARHDASLREAIEQHGGHVFKTIGDAFCAAFASVPEALAAALAGQRALRREGSEIRVRMAVHTGEAEARGGDYFGPALNRTARLLTAAHGGQVLLSGAAAAAWSAGAAGSISLRSLGRHQLRDLTEWETIFQLQAPELPTTFPPPNTLDVAERRGRRRAYSISSAIGLVILVLAWAAAHSAAVARRLAEDRRAALDRAAGLLYASQMNLAHLAYKDGEIVRARRLLEAHIPQPGQSDQRDFVWRFLWRLCRSQDRHTFPPRAGEVRSVAFSSGGGRLPGGRVLLAAGGADGAVQVWDPERKLLLATVPAHQGASRVAFSPDGRFLATMGADDGTVKLWELADPAIGTTRIASASRRFPALRDQFPGFRRPNTQICFTPDGKTLIAGAADGTVRLRDLGSGRGTAPGGRPRGRRGSALHGAGPGQPSRSIPIRASGPMALSADGATLAVCAAGAGAGPVTLWKIAARKVKRLPVTLPPVAGLVTCVAFSPDGRMVATGAGNVVLWEVRTGRALRVMTEHEAVILAVAFSPDGRQLASAGFDGTIRLWDPGSGQPLASLSGHMQRVTSIAFSPDGKTLASASGDGTTRLWDTDIGQVRQGARERAEVEILAAGAGGVGGVAFSPDGSLLAQTGAGTALLWNVATRGMIGPPLSTGPVGRRLPIRTGCAFSPDGTMLATGDLDGSTRLWDLSTRRVVATLRGHPSGVTHLGFAAGGVLVTGSGGGNKGAAASVRLWNLASRRLLASLPGDSRLVSGPLAVSIDHKILVTTSPERRIALWDTGSLRRVATLGGEAQGTLAISPDGRRVAGSDPDGTIYLWNRATGRRIRRLVGHTGPVLALVFSPNSRTLASGGMDRTVRLWNDGVDQEEATLTGHRDWVTAIDFSPDGNLLATGSPDGTVRLWRAAPFADVDSLPAVPRSLP